MSRFLARQVLKVVIGNSDFPLATFLLKPNLEYFASGFPKKGDSGLRSEDCRICGRHKPLKTAFFHLQASMKNGGLALVTCRIDRNLLATICQSISSIRWEKSS